MQYPYPYKGEITIEQALAEMRKPGAVFWLAFCRATGKERGKMKIVSRVRYGAPPTPGRVGVRPSELTQHTQPLFTDTSQLPCHNADNETFFTPLISHLEGFNLKKIIHSNVENQ